MYRRLAAASVKRGYVMHDTRIYASEKLSSAKSLATIPLGTQLGIIAHSAVADLYTQVEDAKRR